MSDGGPAFPSVGEGFGNPMYSTPGMTLRDYFAAAALAVSVSNMWESHKMEHVARRCYEYADAMLSARQSEEDR